MGLFETLALAPLFASRRFDVDFLWNNFRNAEITRSFGRNDMLTAPFQF